MKFILEIECDNAAFDESDCGDEVAAILHKLETRLRLTNVEDGVSFPLHDSNGNRVGMARFEGERL